MATVIVYRSKSASYAAKRVAAAVAGIRAVQQDSYRPQRDDTAVVRWDCYEKLPTADAIDINPVKAVQAARNKIVSRTVTGDLSPETWTDLPSVQVPCVVRPQRHKAGSHFYVCRTFGAVRAAIKRLSRRDWYASRLLDKAREFRVFVVQGRVVAVSERFPGRADAIAWNLALGGRLINVERKAWPVEVLRVAIEAMRRVGLGFGAVDACLDTAGRAWVFEVNTSPALRNKYTIKQLAKGLAAVGEEPKPVKEGAQKPRSYAHPAVVRAQG